MERSLSTGAPPPTGSEPNLTQRDPTRPNAAASPAGTAAAFPATQWRSRPSASPARRSSPTGPPPPPGSGPLAPLHGPRGAHAPRVIDVRIATELLPDGTGRSTLTPLALRQARFPASTPMQLAAAVEMVRTELEIAGYERWKGFRPSIVELGDADHDAVSEPKPTAPAPPPYLNRHEQAWRTGGNDRERNPAEYAWRADGTVTSPGGKHIRDPKAIDRIRVRCVKLGLSTAPEVFDLGEATRAVSAAAVAAGCTEHEWLSVVVAREVARQAAVARRAARKGDEQAAVYRANRGAALRTASDGQVPLFPAPVPAFEAAGSAPVVVAPVKAAKATRRLRSAS